MNKYDREMTIWQIGNLIRAYGKANRQWYQHQSDGQAIRRADRLQRQCCKAIVEIREKNSKMADRLNDLLLTAHWSTISLQPRR